MKPFEIKESRRRLGYTQKFVAEQLGMSQPSYRKKESGDVKFSDEEKAKLAVLLELSLPQINDYLYDGLLPIDRAVPKQEIVITQQDGAVPQQACPIIFCHGVTDISISIKNEDELPVFRIAYGHIIAENGGIENGT